MSASPITLGLRVRKGGAVCVAVAIENGAPRIITSTFLEIGNESDRLALAPYATARERVLAGDAVGDVMAVVAEGRRRQDAAAADGLRKVIERLTPVKAALLVNRAGWITDLLTYSLEWTEHVPVAEGLAVRDAFRSGCKACKLELVEFDETTLMARAAACEAQLKAMGVGLKPWRKEQKLAALAAWTALASPAPTVG